MILNRMTRTIVDVGGVLLVADKLAQLDDGVHRRFDDQHLVRVQHRRIHQFRKFGFCEKTCNHIEIKFNYPKLFYCKMFC